MKKITLTFILIISVLIFNSLVSYASTANTNEFTVKPVKTLEQKNAELEKKLKFTNSQRRKARTIRLAEQRETKKIENEIKAKNTQLKSIEDSGFEFGKVKAKRAQKKQLKKDIIALEQKKIEVTAKYTKQYDAMLTANQKKQLDKIRAENLEKLNSCKKCAEHAKKCKQNPCKHKKWFHGHS